MDSRIWSNVLRHKYHRQELEKELARLQALKAHALLNKYAPILDYLFDEAVKFGFDDLAMQFLDLVN